MKWICAECNSEMKVENEGNNRNRVYCSNCGTEWYVDDDDEYINEGSSIDDIDDDFELANFCRGGDLTED